MCGLDPKVHATTLLCSTRFDTLVRNVLHAISWGTTSPVVGALQRPVCCALCGVWCGAGNIRVFSRTRPLLEKDRAVGAKMSVEFDSLNPGAMLARGTNGKPREFEFDRAFDPSATQGKGLWLTAPTCVYHIGAPARPVAE